MCALLAMKQLCLFLFYMSLSQSVSKATECKNRGRYPNNEASDCLGYSICILGPANFTQYNLTCPKGFIYSHVEQQCTNVTSYHCFPTYNCTSPGNLENPDSDNCTTYIACLEGINGLVTARLIRCPINTVYNPISDSCVNETEYTCAVNSIVPKSESEENLIQYYDSFYVNGVIKVQVKNAVALCSMTMLFALK